MRLAVTPLRNQGRAVLDNRFIYHQKKEKETPIF